MENLKKRFDYVIIDTAPIGPVTDAQLLSKFVDATIFMVRHKHTPSVFLRMIDFSVTILFEKGLAEGF